MAPFTIHYLTVTFIVLVAAITFAFSLFLRQSILKTTLLQGESLFFRRAVVIAVVLAVTIMVTGYIATVRLLKNEERRIGRQAALTVAMVQTAVEGSINRIDAGAATLAGSPWVLPVFMESTPESIDKAHSVLDRYCRTFGAAVVYLLDTTGVTIASSNRSDHDSFLGRNYSFRPYFTGALQGNSVSYFAVGVTSGKRGYYRSTPVTDSAGRVMGVAVIKNSLHELDSVFASAPDAFLVDERKMIFFASDTALQGRLFCSAADSPAENHELREQYGNYSLEPVVNECGINGKTVRYRGQKHLFSRITLKVPDWSIVIISSLVSVQRYYLLGLSLTVVFLLIVLVAFSLTVLHQVKAWAESVFLSEKRFRTVFEAAPEAIVIAECETGVIVAGNQLSGRFLHPGSEPARVFEVLADPVREQPALPLTPNMVQGIFRVTMDGTARCLSVSSAALQFKGKKCIVSFWRDVTDIIETQNALETSERQYRELTELLPEGVFEINAEGKITYANRRALEMFGFTSADLAKKISPTQVVIPRDAPRAAANIQQIMRDHIPGHHEYTALHSGGRTFPMLVHSTVVMCEEAVKGICGVAIDLTERKRIEQELQKKEKLEALGILAGGIAHDFNNLLTAVWSGFSMIRTRLQQDADMITVANEMENALRRGRDLTSQLLTYSKGGAPVKSTASLYELVKETSNFITSGTTVKCVIEKEDDLYPVDIDGTQISRVVQNILLNAIEAMPSGGVVTLRLKNCECKENVGELPPGRYVEMVVNDTGTGIAADIQPRIFDPFYTTKPNGSGLGLATTYSIIKKHNGYISVVSSVGFGTSVHVILPASDKNVSAANVPEPSFHPGEGHILLMDDEPTILKVTEKLLSMMGYSVETAVNGEEAVARYREAMDAGRPFDAAILDLTVPAGMGGRETVKRILKIDPDAKAIVSSGYSNDPIMADYRTFGFKAVIAKPYDVKQLRSVIQSLMATHFPE